MTLSTTNIIKECLIVHAVKIEGILSRNHFVQDNPKRPMIDSKAMSSVVNDLRGDVLWRATKSIELVFYSLGCSTQDESESKREHNNMLNEIPKTNSL